MCDIMLDTNTTIKHQHTINKPNNNNNKITMTATDILNTMQQTY